MRARSDPGPRFHVRPRRYIFPAGFESTRGGGTDMSWSFRIGRIAGTDVKVHVTFLLLVRPFVLKLQGATRLAPAGTLMTAHFDWRGDKRREFLRVRRNADVPLKNVDLRINLEELAFFLKTGQGDRS